MNPFLPFLLIPALALGAWFIADQWSGSSPGHYRIPKVSQIDPPAELPARDEASQQPQDILIGAFLPQIPPTPAPEAPSLALQSIMTSHGTGYATINGQLVSVGDRIAGYQVRRITDDGVSLARGNNTRHLPMRPLHELPPPSTPGADLYPPGTSRQNATEAFWRVMNSYKPKT